MPSPGGQPLQHPALLATGASAPVLTLCSQRQCVLVLLPHASVSPGRVQPQPSCLTTLSLTNLHMSPTRVFGLFWLNCTFKMLCSYYLLSGVNLRIYIHETPSYILLFPTLTLSLGNISDRSQGFSGHFLLQKQLYI